MRPKSWTRKTSHAAKVPRGESKQSKNRSRRGLYTGVSIPRRMLERKEYSARWSGNGKWSPGCLRSFAEDHRKVHTWLESGGRNHPAVEAEEKLGVVHTSSDQSPGRVLTHGAFHYVPQGDEGCTRILLAFQELAISTEVVEVAPVHKVSDHVLILLIVSSYNCLIIRKCLKIAGVHVVQEVCCINHEDESTQDHSLRGPVLLRRQLA